MKATDRYYPRNRFEAERYLDAVSATDDFQSCEYGHVHCALKDGGPCSNRVAVEFGIDGADAD